MLEVYSKYILKGFGAKASLGLANLLSSPFIASGFGFFGLVSGELDSVIF
jgi:hypothetical protein